MTPSEWDLLLNQGTPSALFIVFILGLMREWWVLGGRFRELRDDRDFWRTVALGGLETAEKTLDLHERTLHRRIP